MVAYAHKPLASGFVDEGKTYLTGYSDNDIGLRWRHECLKLKGSQRRALLRALLRKLIGRRPVYARRLFK